MVRVTLGTVRVTLGTVRVTLGTVRVTLGQVRLEKVFFSPSFFKEHLKKIAEFPRQLCNSLGNCAIP
jgi:hypothetical protein